MSKLIFVLSAQHKLPVKFEKNFNSNRPISLHGNPSSMGSAEAFASLILRHCEESFLAIRSKDCEEIFAEAEAGSE